MKQVIFFFSFIISFASNGQVEESVDVITQRHAASLSFKTTAIDDTILLPVIDEFTSQSTYPNPEIWVDNFVLINSTHSENPLSIGVATFDGLNENGFPYHPTNNSSDTLADVLTSKYFDLRGENNVFLSFHYQGGGLGEAPGPDDSLVVEFWTPADSTWEQVWTKKGSKMSIFKPAIIAVDSSKWLQNGFRFRFGAYGARNGAFDVWNIDYFYFSDNRNPGDSIAKDPAFIEQLPSITKTYSSVPWFHFNNNLLKDTVVTKYRRNGPTPSPPWSLTKDKFTLVRNGIVEETSAGFVNSNDPHNVDLDNPMFINTFNPPPATEAFSLGMACVLPGTKVEPFTANDTLIGRQEFKNYYAFDDGTAERAYGVKSNTFGPRMAIRLQAEQPDSLKGVYFRFVHGGIDASQYTFKICIWESNNGEPGNLIYQSDSNYTPDYGYYHNSFIPYQLDTSAIYLNGPVYIGYRQNTNDETDIIHVGLDINTPKATPVFYGDLFFWYESQAQGTVMLRPYFKYQPFDLGFAENEGASIKIYPNPVDDILYVESESALEYWISDISGRAVQHGKTDGSINLADLNAGLYIITFEDKGQTFLEKIIVQ